MRVAALITVIATLDGPAFAQVDLTGTWGRSGQSDNVYAVEPVDLLGMPLNADGRAKALSYDIAALSATERQCQMYPPFYAVSGPFPLQISMVQEPVTQKLLAWKIAGWGDCDETTIWMDGRPHPSQYAPLPHGGFTTGTWEGDTLTSVTTFLLTCTNSVGSGSRQVVIGLPPSAPVLETFTATPSTLTPNAATTVTFAWTFTGVPVPAPTCTIDGLGTVTSGATQSVTLPQGRIYRLRCTNPQGTATRDVELRGQRVRAGEKLVLWYASANRDEEVFEKPFRFDVRRRPNRHLAFGVGEHFCLGSHLARMETRVLFEELLRRLPDLELAGPVRRLASNFVNGIVSMPVRFHAE